MRWAFALGWLGMTAAGWSEAPMDLDSPFVKTALVQEKTGQVIERTVKKGKLNGTLLELEKGEGGLLILPKDQILAILPRLPKPGMAYLQIDADKALQVLLQAQREFPQRPEVQESVLREWRTLGAITTEHDKMQSAALDEWLQKCGRLSSEIQPEELEKISEEGIGFLQKFPGRAKEIELELKGLRELGGIDLKKADSVRFELGGLSDNILVGVAFWALLLVPLGVALKGLSDGIRGVREKSVGAGLLRILVGAAALAFLWALLDGRAKYPDPDKLSSAAAQRAAWYILNYHEGWKDQKPKKVVVPTPGALAYFGGHVDPGPGADSFPFWYLEKPAVIKTESLLTLHQPVRARFVVLSFSFCFPWPSKGESLVGLEPTQASCGRVPLGSLAGRILWSVFQKFYEPLANQLGVNQGVRWLAGEGENIVVEVPESKKPKPQVKQSLAARELAEIFLQGQGEVYRDQYVTVSGTLDQVSSRRDDVGLGTSLSDGDDMDEFYLVGLPAEGTRRRVRIRCQIKDSSRVYYLDGKGDLFFDRFRTEWKEVAKKKESDLPGKTAIPVKSVLLDKQGSLDPASDSPVFRKGGEVRFSLGRIESGKIEMEAVTLYDCQKFEVKDSAGNWNVVWEAQSK